MIRRATLAEIREELEKGRITESDIRDNGVHWDGWCHFGSKRIVVNPRPVVVHILIHELVHRRFPKWGERRVAAEADRLLFNMSGKDIAAFYRKYQALARKRKSPIVVED
jgi:hypothetical protein